MCSLSSEKDTCTETGCLYVLHAGDGVVRYIGYTIQKPNHRFNQHKKDARKGNMSHRSKWMRKVGIENVQMDVVETYDYPLVSFLHMREIDLIARGRQDGLALTNLTDGGEGGSGFSPTEETRMKLREARLAQRPFTAEELKKRADWIRGQKRPPEFAEKLRAANLGKTHSEEAKRKMSVSKTGLPSYTRSAETLEKNRLAAHNQHHVRKGVVKATCKFCTNQD